MRKHQTHTSPLGIKAISLLLALALTLMLFPAATLAVEDPIPQESAPAGTQKDTSIPVETPEETFVPSSTPEAISAIPETPEDTPVPSDSPERNAMGTSDAVIMTADGLPCISDEVLVQFKSSASDADVAQVLEETDLQPTEELKGNLHVAEVPPGEALTDCIEALEQQPDVLYAQPNYVYYLCDYETVPAENLDENLDENRSSLGITNDTYLGYQWHLPIIGAIDAWDTTMGSSSVRVAVLDTGADLDHPDLVGRIIRQTDVITKDNSSAPFDGSINADDDDGHGTHVAGIIAATANNGQGVTGVAPGVSLIIIDVFKLQYDTQTKTYKNFATTASIAKGITFAINNNADVINLSLGGYTKDSVETNAVAKAANAGIVVVAAAGNDATSKAIYPGDLDSVICVTATDRNNAITSYSNFGSAKDIAAPGGDSPISSNWILSTGLYDDYIWMAGTSMASPIVAGTAALILSEMPELSVDKVKHVLYKTATDLGSVGRDNYYGYGLVNTQVAVEILQNFRTITGISNNDAYGTVKGGDKYLDGDSVTLSAVPKDGYRFVRWTETGSRSAKATFVVSGDRTMTAEFAPIATPLLTVTSAGYDSISLNWTAVEGAYKYEIYRSNTKAGTYSLLYTADSTQLSYINSGLVAEKTYYYRVRAYCSCSTAATYGSFSFTQSARPIFNSIPVAVAKASGYNDVQVTWNATPGATGYEVVRSTTKAGTYTKIYSAPASVTKYTNTGLVGNKRYYYKVRAFRTIGSTTVYTDYSSIVSDVALFPIGSASVTFSGAANVAQGQTFTYSYTLNVKGASTANANIAVGGVFEKVSGGTNLFYDTIPNNTTGSVSGSITVKVKSTAKPGDVGTIFVVTDESTCATLIYDSTKKVYDDPYITTVTGSFSAPVVTPPASPTGIIARTDGFNAIKVSWNAVPEAKGYEVYCSTTKAGTYSRIYTTSSASVLTYTHSGLSANKTYYYKVRAYQTAGSVNLYSDYSTHASAAVVPPTPSPVATSAGYDRNLIKWSVVSSASGYEVYSSNTKAGTYRLIGTTSSTSFTHIGLITDKTYYYKVRAFRTVASTKTYSALSSIVSSRPALSVPTVSANRYSSTQAKLVWNAISGASGYEVYRANSAAGPFAYQKTLTTSSYVNSGLVSGQTYYYQVRAYRIFNGMKIFGRNSSTVNITPR